MRCCSYFPLVSQRTDEVGEESLVVPLNSIGFAYISEENVCLSKTVELSLSKKWKGRNSIL